MHILRIFVLFFFLFSGLEAEEPSLQLEKLKVQLHWRYQFQFAGFIMAKELGYYKDAGLDVSLIEYDGGDIRKSIHDKGADFFLQNGALLFDKKNKLMDVKLLATYFQRSPLVLITQPQIKDVSELKGKKIMTGGNDLYETSLDTLLYYYGINPTTAKFLHHSFNLRDFLQKRVDAISIFTTDQIYDLKKIGAAFNIIDPTEYGYISPANNLFSYNAYVKTHKKEVDAFLAATKKGWKYALSHIPQSAVVIYDKYSKHKSIEALIYEGKTTKALMLQNIFDIGEINSENIKQMYQELLNRKGLKVDSGALQNYIYKSGTQESSLFTPAQIKYLKEKKKITICVDPKWRPYEWIDHAGKYRGMGADYFKLITKKLPAQTQLYKTDNWAETIAAIKDGKCDVLPMAGITEARKKFLNFTSAYYYAPYVVATTLDKSFIEDFREKKDKKYAVIKSSAALDDLKRLYGHVNTVEVATLAEGLNMVQRGKVYGFINTAKAISLYIQEHNLKNIKIDAKLPIGYNIAIATAKNEPMLRDIFQALINAADAKEMDSVKNHWESIVLDVRKDYSFIYKIIAFFSLLFLVLLYRAYVLKRAKVELEERVIQKTVALNRLNKELESKVNARTEELKHLAYYDALTDLPNRVLFEDRLRIAIERSKRSGNLVALFFIDLDRFKEINDSFGHKAGDEMLHSVTIKLLAHVRSEDTLARLGGDEFTLLVESAKTAQECAVIAQKMLAISKEPIQIASQTVYASLSIGIALAPQDATNAEDLLKNADAAMYKAKESGRNTFAFYSPKMSKEAYDRVVLKTRLMEAIKKESFEVYYQPQIDIVAHKVVGLEALVRWKDGDGTIVMPDDFIPLAEESGLIVDLDKIIFAQAVSQFAKWSKEGIAPQRISINLAAKEFANKNFGAFLSKELEACELGENCLELEITESDIMRNPEDAIEKLEKMKNLGIQISIDDFGTGYSSLAYLKRLPIDKLKIDKSFVKDIPGDDDDCAIVKAVIALGNTLGLTLIAEGVETKEQEEFLLENGCTLVQGYYHSKPMSAKETEKFLREF